MAVREGFVVGLGVSVVGILLLQVRILWCKYPPASGGHIPPKKIEKLNNKLININKIRNYAIHECSYFYMSRCIAKCAFSSKCAFLVRGVFLMIFLWKKTSMRDEVA